MFQVKRKPAPPIGVSGAGWLAAMYKHSELLNYTSARQKTQVKGRAIFAPFFKVVCIYE
jgi:hypothetical protein